MVLRKINFETCLMTVFDFRINLCVFTAGIFFFNRFFCLITATTMGNFRQMNPRQLTPAKMQAQGNTNYGNQVKGT